MFGIRTVKSGCREKEEYYTQDESLSAQSKQKQSSVAKEKESVAFSQDEYYTNEQKLNQDRERQASNTKNSQLTTAIFYGKGATKLGLEGEVTQE